MEIAMLILTIISTMVAIISLIWSIRIKKETKEIKKQITIVTDSNNNIKMKNEIKDNSGVVAETIKGEVTLNGK